MDANYFRRLVNNYADDDQIANTTISFPIAFRKSIIYGAEAKIEMPDWRRFSGFLSYSYTVGNAWFPVTGGLFLGDDASAAASQVNGHFPDSQDQRNTIRGRLRYQVAPRFWIAGGIQYDTGLPFEFDGDPAEALAQYGQQVLDRINFARGRIYPSFQVNASAGVDVYRSERMNVRLQADGQNLTNVLWTSSTSAACSQATRSGRREATPCDSRPTSKIGGATAFVSGSAIPRTKNMADALDASARGKYGSSARR